MPISAWILTPRHTLDASLVAALASDDSLLLGEPQGQRLPLVLDTTSIEEEARIVQWILAHAEVATLDLVCVDFSDVPPSDCNRVRLKHRLPLPQ